jgi:ribosomal protein S18 acetylase RimI-like enzyme
VPNYIHPSTLEAAYEVASNLRQEDLEECIEGWGIKPTLDIPLASLKGFCVYFTVPNGKTAGIAGIHDDGQIWMLCTKAIHEYPLTFAREAKRFIDSRPEPYLWNVVDARNTAHLKLLTYLGFEFHETIAFGPNNLPFIRFSRGTPITHIR